MKSFTVAWLALVIATAGAVAAGPAREVVDKDIDRAVAGAKRFLYAQQTASGAWPQWSHRTTGEHNTVIAMLALLESGESRNNARIKKGLAALVKFDTRNLYTIATRVMVLARAGAGEKNSPYHGQLLADVKRLTAGAARGGGAWGYGGPERTGDNSCSQFALLALWEADRAGVKIDPALIRLVERTWVRRQRPDGGWVYAGQPDLKATTTVSMTTAGLASLYICQDVLTKTCQPYAHRKSSDRGWKFLADRLGADYHRDGYVAFCVQRVGMASGQKFIGTMDWFGTGAAKLAEPSPYGSRYTGQWGPIVRASFELLFLTRGRIPLTFNKLAHGKETSWNFHTRDVPHFTEHMRRNFERIMRWQIVGITDDVAQMLDAPILLVAGRDALDFTPDQWAKLREYSLSGGTLLLVPSHNSKGFFDSAKAGLETLYADWIRNDSLRYTLQPLEADHPIYSVHEPVPNGSRAAPLWGVSDGTRLLAVLSRRDIACPWQRRAHKAGRIDYLMGVNFFLYATGSNSLRMRMRPVFAGGTGRARHTVRVARLRHRGNASTQPYALKYLSDKLTAENRVKLTVTENAAIDAKTLAGHHLAWMTGSDAFTLSDGQIRALRAYLDGGGTLFVNALGGSRAFAESAEKMLDEVFANVDVLAGNASPVSPVMTGRCGEFRGLPLTGLERTLKWRNTRDAPAAPVKAYHHAGRAMAIYAPFGVHDTLDGHAAHGARSYMPPSARQIAANVVLCALMAKPAPKPGHKPLSGPAPAPATQPAPAGK